MKRSYAELSEIFTGMASAKAVWLREHGPKRSEMNRMQIQRELEACSQVAEWLRRAAERKPRRQQHERISEGNDAPPDPTVG